MPPLATNNILRETTGLYHEALHEPAVAQVAAEMDALDGARLEAFRSLVPVTPMVEVAGLAPGYECFVKDESVRDSGAYKEGIAANVLLKYAEDPRASPLHGVVVASTGNFAAGTAVVARRLRVPQAESKCPTATNSAKLNTMRANGMHVDATYADLDAAIAAAEKKGQEPGWLFIHPFNDPAGIAANGVIGRDAMEQLQQQGIDPNDPTVETTILVTGGGGGIGSGIALEMARTYPRVQVVVGQMAGGAGIADALEGKPSDHAAFDYSCDGAAVPTPGELALDIFRALGTPVMRVSKGAVGRAIHTLKRPLGKAVEPAAAVAVATAQQYAMNTPARPDDDIRRVMVMIVSGANTTPAKLAEFQRAAFKDEAEQNRQAFTNISERHLRRQVYGIRQAVGATAVTHG